MSDRMQFGAGEQADRQVQCSHCDRGFDPQQAHRIRVHESTAEYTCPWCKRTVSADPPLETIERPPAIVNRSCTTDEQESTAARPARLFFEGGAWLQFRETEDGWIREEMFDADGEMIESFIPELDREEYDSPVGYLQQVADRYPTYTKTGLRVQRPHIATVLLDEQ